MNTKSTSETLRQMFSASQVRKGLQTCIGLVRKPKGEDQIKMAANNAYSQLTREARQLCWDKG